MTPDENPTTPSSDGAAHWAITNAIHRSSPLLDHAVSVADALEVDTWSEARCVFVAHYLTALMHYAGNDELVFHAHKKRAGTRNQETGNAERPYDRSMFGTAAPESF